MRMKRSLAEKGWLDFGSIKSDKHTDRAIPEEAFD